MSQGGSVQFSMSLNKGTSSNGEPNQEGENSNSPGNVYTSNAPADEREEVKKDSESAKKDGRLISVNVPTGKNSRKRKQILTDFDSPNLLNYSALSAQQKEKERLERLKAKDNENDHLDQFAALHASQDFSPLPVFDADDIDEITGFNDKYMSQNVGPSTSRAQPEVIDLSSDDEDDIQEVGVFRRVVEPKTTIAKRQRWFMSDKERAVRETMDHQHRIEQQRLRKRQNVGDIEHLDLTSGKLIVNRGHPPQDPDIAVATHLTHVLQPHQLGGIRFMYDNVVESLDEYNNSPGFGCILAHSMGLGKTLQVITFTEIFFRATRAHKALIIVPVNTLQNWWNEFDKWLPKTDVSGAPIRNFEVFLLGDLVKTFDQRVNLLERWNETGGVLLIGYDLFRLLIRATQPKKPSRMKINFINGQKVNRDEPVDDYNKGYTNDGRIKYEANQIVRRALLDPGPNLVVCDEGHKIKNLNTDISTALSSIKTTRRIVLTGYPLQNNLMEYYCMVDFVRPKYLGERKSFSLMFERPIKNGQCVDSTPGDVKVALQRTHVLVEMLKGFVQRRTHHLLKSILPVSKEYVLLLRKSPLQHALYRNFLLYANAEVQKGGSVFNPLKAFAACSKIWNHPDVLARTVVRKNNDKIKQEQKKQQASSQAEQRPMTLADAFNQNNYAPVTHRTLWDGLGYANDLDIADADDEPVDKPRRRSRKNLVSAILDDFEEEDQGLKYDWAEIALQHHKLGQIEHGYKMKIALDIINETTRFNEKILLFSQNLTALDLIEEYLFKRYVTTSTSTEEEFWVKNKNYFRLDGSTNGTEREKLINKFNNDPSIRLFLISTRAGSLGINLVSANRCIILDACWNPCHDAQAVCRVYRYGQQKKTYIYRLVMDNSMEKAIFNRQVSKHGLQQRVVDDAKVEANVTQKELETLLMYDESKDVVHSEWDTSLWNIEDPILARVVQRNSKMLSQEPFLHESLILEKEEGLSEQEKREAQLLYEKERAAEVSAPYEVLDRLPPAPRQVRPGDPINMFGSIVNNGINPLRPTPYPNEIEQIDYRLPVTMNSSGGGITMAGAMNGMTDISRPYLRNPMYSNSGHPMLNHHPFDMNQQNGYIAPQIDISKWVPGLFFPGAERASEVISSRAGTMQRILLDRDHRLPLVQDASQYRFLPKGSEVILVRAGTGGVFIKTSNGEIVNAEGTVFTGVNPAPGYFASNSLRLPPPLITKSAPEVIDLD